MAAYMIIEVEVTDQDLHEEYRQRLSPVIAQLGGRRLMNTGTPRNMAGDWNLRQLILIEFPGIDEAKRYTTAMSAGEFQEMQQMCIGERNIVIAEGLP